MKLYAPRFIAVKLVIPSLSLLLSGCAATEPWGALDVSDATEFKAGEANKDAILTRFGEPSSTTSGAIGREMWHYFGNWVHTEKEQAEGRSLTFVFDEHDWLRGIYYFHAYSDGEIPSHWHSYPLPEALVFGAQRWDGE